MEVTQIDGRLRFCAFETYDGVRRHYLCGHHKYCCELGCCVSNSFSFYQLWYFWLLLLLMILMCSGGGWWFRWRHGNLTSRDPTPRRRYRGTRGERHGRIYPHQGGHYPPHVAYSLPDDVDKDPPSYNEVVRHLNNFPVASSLYTGDPARRNTVRNQAQPPNNEDCWSAAAPPPSYEMVLELKRKQQELEVLTADENIDPPPPTEPTQPSGRMSARDRIRRIFGLNTENNTNTTRNEATDPPPFFISPATPNCSSPLQEDDKPNILPPSNTINQQSVFIYPGRITQSNSPDVDNQNNLQDVGNDIVVPNIDPPFTISRTGMENRYHPDQINTDSNPNDPSQSEYFNFMGSLSSIESNSTRYLYPPSPPPMRSSLDPGDVDHCSTYEEPRSRSALSYTSRRDSNLERIQRPDTSRSILSRPSTSISVRSIPPSQERRTSLPGALSESDELARVIVRPNSSLEQSNEEISPNVTSQENTSS